MFSVPTKILEIPDNLFHFLIIIIIIITDMY